MAYIEPCCIDNQLPALIRESRNGFAFFQTSGDVTLEKLLGAVSHMAGDSHVIVLTVAEVDVMMLRTLAYYFRRGWTKALLLLTQKSQRELIENELAGYIDRVQYAADPLVIDGQVAVVGSSTLIILGAILGQVDFSLSFYSVWLGNDVNVARAALDPVIAKLNTKPVIDHHGQADIARILTRNW